MKPLLYPRRFCLLVALSSSFVAVPSFASQTYPATLKAMLNLKAEPKCTLCHANDLGGAGTVVTKFGKALIARGASGSSNARSLSKALNSEQDDPVDSDGDGVDDLHELLDGSDPNVADREPPPPPDTDPMGEGGGGSTGPGPSTASGGASSSQQGKGGTAATAARGGTSSTSGGTAATPDEPDLDPTTYPEYPDLQTGCSLGARTAPGSLAGLVALSLFGLMRSRRSRRPPAQR